MRLCKRMNVKWLQKAYAQAVQGYGEKNWIGKYKCKTYNEIKKRVANDNKNTASLSK